MSLIHYPFDGIIDCNLLKELIKLFQDSSISATTTSFEIFIQIHL